MTRDERREYMRAWRAANPGRVREAAARYREAHRELCRERVARCHRRKRAEAAATRARWLEIAVAAERRR